MTDEPEPRPMGFWQTVREDVTFYGSLFQKPWRAFAHIPVYIMLDYRLGHFATSDAPVVVRAPARAAYQLTHFFITSTSGAFLHPKAKIGRRLHIHSWHGLNIPGGARVGDDCTVNAAVSMVAKANGRGEGIGRVGDRVYLGVGAKIVGGITVGEDSIIGVNAVVTRDVEPGRMVMSPAPVIVPRPLRRAKKPANGD